MRRRLFSQLVTVLLAGAVPLAASLAETPIVTDSRIKTFVYNENEVFAITTHDGYQSNIEFGPKETIDTISVGDRVAWQIIPAGRRLFIRAMEENAHTNMTVVTNLHAYQFDLRSSSAESTFGSEALTYVVRFFYPGDAGYLPQASTYQPTTAPMPASMPPAPAPVAYSAPVPQALPSPAPITYRAPPPAPYYSPPAAPAPYSPVSAVVPSSSGALNYHYTYSGSSTTAPVKIYDDGHATYFKYRDATAPKVAVITARGEQLSVPTRRMADNIVAVDIIAPRFSLNQPGGQIVVYNESSGA